MQANTEPREGKQDIPGMFNENKIEPQCNLSKQVIIKSTRKHNMQKETMEGHPNPSLK